MKWFLILFFMVLPAVLFGQLKGYYNLPLNEGTIKNRAIHQMDSLLRLHPMLQEANYKVDAKPGPPLENKSFPFFLILGMLLLLGTLRRADPRFFLHIKQGLTKNAQGRAKPLDNASLFSFQQIMLNTFACISIGVFWWGVWGTVQPAPFKGSSFLMAGLCIILVAGVYFIKFLFLKLTGWALGISRVLDIYISNVMLVNKVMGMVLIPFSTLLLLSPPSWHSSIISIAISAVGILLIIRFVRSWNAFGSLAHFSRFHFFTYICASEILPVLVLLKLLQSGFHL